LIENEREIAKTRSNLKNHSLPEGRGAREKCISPAC